MSGKNKNRKNSQLDFLCYRREEMTGEERNSFERELQKDLFAEEALEGLDTISYAEASKDLARLQNRLKTRTIRRQRFVYYRIAASVAVLLVISTIYFVTKRENQVSTISENIIKEEIVLDSAPAQESISLPVEKAAEKKEDINIIPAKKTITNVQPDIIKVEENQVAGVQVAEAQPQILEDSEGAKTDLLSMQAEVIEDKFPAAEKKMEMARAAGAPANYKSVALTDYDPPRPVIGKDSFEIYLEKNIRYPEPKTGRQKLVLVSFTVRTDSTIRNIKVINTPGQPYSREAIRLIKDGPKWIPAKEKGIVIEDEIRQEILFKEN